MADAAAQKAQCPFLGGGGGTEVVVGE